MPALNYMLFVILKFCLIFLGEIIEQCMHGKIFVQFSYMTEAMRHVCTQKFVNIICEVEFIYEAEKIGTCLTYIHLWPNAS